MRLIDELALDGEKITVMRYQIIRTIRSAQCYDWKLFLMWMGPPKDLPNLANFCTQLGNNTLPGGIAQSFYRKPRPDS